MPKYHDVFVYGSLLPGLHNHHILSRSDAQPLGERKTMPAYDMYSLGYFPAVCDNGETAIHGALYRVNNDILAQLDHLESSPDWYKRTRVNIAATDSAPQCRAWMYVMPRDTPELQHGSDALVPDGDWRTFVTPAKAPTSWQMPSHLDLATAVAPRFAHHTLPEAMLSLSLAG